jgi:tetratricopeptide (TPR) repeat protein
VAALVGLVTWYNVRRDAATVRTGSPVLLADVENLTGDSTFDRTLYLAASVGLQQSRQISLFPRSRVRETLALMQRPGADSVLDESLAREVATRENLQRVLLLGVARIDSAFVLTARIIHPPSGRDLFVDRARAATRGDILDQLDGLLTRVRRASGESGDSLRAYAVPLPRVTTSSLVALHAYAAGTDAWTRRRYDEAKAAFQRAVALDSTFALAWLGLAEVSYQLYRDRPAGDAALTQALQYADRLTERERLRLEQAALGYRGRVDQEVRIAEQLARRFPERDTWYSLGTFLMRLRRCPEAIPALERSLEFDSTFAGAHINVATCHQFLGASDSAVAAYGRAYAVDTASVYTGGLNHEFGIALVRAGRVDSARRVFERMARRSQPQDRQFGQRSLGYLAAWLGRARDADAHFDSAAVLAAGFGTHLSEFRNRILQAETRLTMGMRSRASLSLDASTQLATRLTLDPGFAMHAGLAYVTAGQLARASKMLEVIVAGSRAASASDRTIHAVMSARIALARGDTDGARRALEAATDTTWNDFVLPALLDVHAARGHADSALDASMRLASRSTFGTAAQEAWMRNLVRLAESAERIGRRDLAQETYVRLEAQLSAGDPDHPLLTEARAGIARLAGRDARQELPVRPPRP